VSGLHLSASLAPDARRCAEALAPQLERVAAAVPAATVLVGLPDPPEWGAIAARFAGCVLVPLLGPDRPTAAHAGPLRAAGALVAVAGDELQHLASLGTLPPVVMTDLPAPPAHAAAGVLAQVGRPEVDAAAWAWQAVHGPLPDDGPAVVWATGRGAAPLCTLRCAAADRAAVVVLPGCADRERLAAGGCLVAGSVAEAVEITALLRAAPALHDAVTRRIRNAAAVTPRDVLESVLEAAVLASGA